MEIKEKMTVYILENPAESVQRMVDYFRTAQSDINDFNEGSEIRNLLESVGLSTNHLLTLIDYMLKMGYVQTATGNFLDMLGVMVNCRRIAAVKSTGTVTFSTPASKSEDIPIPSGTLLLCSSESSLYFSTTTSATLTAGQTTVNVEAQALVGGTQGNVAAGKIDTINTAISDLTVTNNSPFSEGVNQECDNAYRIRILQAGQGSITGSVAWYKTVAASVSGVHDVGVVNNPGGNIDILLLVNGTVKPTSDSIVEAVEELFADEDYMIGGINVGVDKPSFITQNINATIILNDGYVWEEVESEIESDLAAYFNRGTTSYGTNYSGLNCGEDIIKSTIQLIIANNPGVSDYAVTNPAVNVTVEDDEAALLGTITLTEG